MAIEQKKSRVGGLWLRTRKVPSVAAIGQNGPASTHPFRGCRGRLAPGRSSAGLGPTSSGYFVLEEGAVEGFAGVTVLAGAPQAG